MRARCFLAAGLAVVALFSDDIARAQIIPDTTLGSELSTFSTDVTVGGELADLVEGGATRGSNLFHSFNQFNVAPDQRVYFAVDAISNIFARVTGTTLSDIQGTLGTCNISDCSNLGTDATLYLMNPNGIVFGPNATLDIAGSFVATTANEIEFAEQGVFSATKPLVPSQQLVINPSALLFNQLNITQPLNSIESRATLTLPEQRSLVWVGGNASTSEAATGNIVIREGRLRAPGGNIDIGGLTDIGRVGLNIEGINVGIVHPKETLRIDFTMTGEANGFAELDVTSGGGGDINVYADDINILGGSDICAGIGAAFACGFQAINFGMAGSQAGNILFDALGAVRIADPFSVVENDVNPDAIGNSGNIVIVADSLVLENGGKLSTSIYGTGNSGKVIADVNRDIRISQLTEDVDTSIISNVVGFGESGGVELSLTNLVLDNGAQIRSQADGQGNSGNIKIEAQGAVRLTGRIIRATDSSRFVPSAIRTDVFGEGNGGDIIIHTDNLQMLNGTQILAITRGLGNAGDILIEAQGDVTLVDSDFFTEIGQRNVSINPEEDTPLEGGDIVVTASSLFLLNSSSILADNEYFGNAGNIQLNIENDLVIRGRGPSNFDPNDIVPSQISSGIDPGAIGSGGTININSTQLVLEDDGFIRTSNFGEGTTGDININSNVIQLISGGAIAADTFEIGNGGKISIQATDILLTGSSTDNGTASAIDAEVAAGATGNSGEIEINTDRLRLDNGGRISTRTFGNGNSGPLTVRANDFIEIVGTNDSGFRRSNINAITESSGLAGNLTLTAGQLIIREGGGIAVASFGSGNAGTLTVEATGDIFISGVSQDGSLRSQIDSQSNTINSDAAGGQLFLSGSNLQILDGGLITSTSLSRGDAGPISITLSEVLQMIDGEIISVSDQSSGGDLSVRARSAILREDSNLRTNSSGIDGGDINLNIPVVVLLEDSDILAFAPNGKGGNITLNTLALLSDPLSQNSQLLLNSADLERLDGNETVDINATGSVSGDIIGIPEITFLENSFTELPDNLVNTDSLVANSCVARSDNLTGSLIVTDRDGLPDNPNANTITSFSLDTVNPIVSDKLVDAESLMASPSAEPGGIYQLADGRLVMSHVCY